MTRKLAVAIALISQLFSNNCYSDIFIPKPNSNTAIESIDNIALEDILLKSTLKDALNRTLIQGGYFLIPSGAKKKIEHIGENTYQVPYFYSSTTQEVTCEIPTKKDIEERIELQINTYLINDINKTVLNFDNKIKGISSKIDVSSTLSYSIKIEYESKTEELKGRINIRFLDYINATKEIIKLVATNDQYINYTELSAIADRYNLTVKIKQVTALDEQSASVFYILTEKDSTEEIGFTFGTFIN